MQKAKFIPKAFIARRIHSSAGLWLSLFLIFHLFDNSQAALFFGDDGSGFIRAVNWIHSLPYLPLIELSLLAVPIFFHAVFGIKYALEARFNSFPSDGTTPALTRYARNHAYTWQRITSWVLLIGLLAHIVHMRFLNFPEEKISEGKTVYEVTISDDEGLPSVAKRLGVKLSGASKEVKAEALDFGTAELLVVRNSFKSPLTMFLYAIFVLAACFHGFNGAWTFLVSWGMTLSKRSQALSRKATNALMFLVAFLGMSAIFFTYWINLKN